MKKTGKQIKTLLFDFDGTLMDTTNVIVKSWQQVYRKVTGKEADLKTILATFGSILEDGLADAFPDEPVDELLKIYRGYHHEHFLELIDLYPGIEDMLNGLKDAGITMALVTSRLKKTTMEAVSEFGLDRFFDVVITADDCAARKPDPEPILVTLEKLEEQKLKSTTINSGNQFAESFGAKKTRDGRSDADRGARHLSNAQIGTERSDSGRVSIDKETVMMVGDTIYDRECARNAGVRCALVSWAPSIDVHALKGSDIPEYILEKPDDIFDIIS